jgi:hypothetical protein
MRIPADRRRGCGDEKAFADVFVSRARRDPTLDRQS